MMLSGRYFSFSVDLVVRPLMRRGFAGRTSGCP